MTLRYVTLRYVAISLMGIGLAGCGEKEDDAMRDVHTSAHTLPADRKRSTLSLLIPGISHVGRLD